MSALISFQPSSIIIMRPTGVVKSGKDVIKGRHWRKSVSLANARRLQLNRTCENSNKNVTHVRRQPKMSNQGKYCDAYRLSLRVIMPSSFTEDKRPKAI